MTETLPLTVLAYDGPILRAYLALMRHQGLRARRILVMVPRKPALPGGRILPLSVRQAYGERRQADSYLYWPRWIRKNHPALYEIVTTGMSRILGMPTSLYSEMLEARPWADYADQVQRIITDGLGDAALHAVLAAEEADPIVFTGGGLVPRSLFQAVRVPILHVHPGYLPEIRGADGLLWSCLIRGRAGASCFVMEPGLDVGPVLDAREFPPFSFSLSGQGRPNDQTLYRTLMSYCDPMIRAVCLVDTLQGQSKTGFSLKGAPQDLERGTTFHFMHAHLRAKLLTHLFQSE